MEVTTKRATYRIIGWKETDGIIVAIYKKKQPPKIRTIRIKEVEQQPEYTNKQIKHKKRGQFNILRQIIFDKRGYKCHQCKHYGNITHHIKPTKDYPDLYLEESNIMILCKKCHRLQHKELPDCLF
jgi:5-methylcytosine-specific restriction protein A